ncbi:forkhead box protein O1-A-like [Entelurus aequoreus]|uniref:forkhead box protein O1-A-like n=1 Tax=Entelurus aequoreus TaxID=161455 RepID=UPI002B1D6044|nr:forkhead box protein O1-A-like [Entelurus aequoreus]
MKEDRDRKRESTSCLAGSAVVARQGRGGSKGMRGRESQTGVSVHGLGWRKSASVCWGSGQEYEQRTYCPGAAERTAVFHMFLSFWDVLLQGCPNYGPRGRVRQFGRTGSQKSDICHFVAIWRPTKNSIRHNLSLHSRFIRVQNEGTGKSSWWMLNPEGGKSGKSPRRRAASMDNNSKFTKSRGRAAKKKLSLQGGPDGGADSPGPYNKWPGSPNSHSNDDFDAWSSFRPRTSSNASTVSGRLSPFMPEDDLGEAEVHMGYPGAPGPKMTATLPSLTEMTGSLGHGSENVMENLLDNLNLLSPNNSQVGGGATTPGSAQSSPSPMRQPSPGYPSYSSPSMVSQPPQEYRKCVYGQAGLNAMTMQTLPESKTAFGPYSCSAGLLKELLTSDTDQHRDLLPAVDAVVSRSSGSCMLPPYAPKLMAGGNVHHHGLPHPRQAPPTSSAMNGRLLMSLNHSSKNPMPVPYGLTSHLGGVPGAFCPINTNGYGRLGPAPPPHPEKLPSDLDDMSIEKFEFDMETVLHETLMDGDSLDFNFEPMVTQQGFPHGVKTTTHSWVSG